MNLDNCPRCGKLFAKNFRDICPSCMREIDKEYESCAEFLRKNRGAIIYEVSEHTNVSIRQITRFIREGRISLIEAYNLGYPCEVCGDMIRENNMCNSCRSRLIKEVNRLEGVNTDDSRAAASRLSYQINERLKDR
ncbi:TIGR03826 family flagellar region protein [Paenibacillus beijingensis]|uniref:Flagellar protein n=1 Tax=Paenibacillus beijingensis TaxID=1126833 RepID=A0A0D5NHA6_9BACL|nr:TIGR03826 family flagellar region protein [Paenibacillus beijingensis]AJY74520.1 flagellar protein [Paenibacillus beijingensis]